MNKRYLKMNLQFFAGEEEPEPAGEEQDASPEQQESQPEPVNPLWDDDETETSSSDDGEQGQQETNEPKTINFGGREINPNDPEAWEAAQKDYSELNRTYQQQQQQFKQLQEMNEQYQKMLEQQQQNEQPQEEQQPEYTEEDFRDFEDKYEEIRFDQGKIEADKWAQEQPIYQKNVLGEQQDDEIEQIKQHYQQEMNRQQWENAVQNVRTAFDDFDNHTDTIQQIYQDAEQSGKPMGPQDLEQVYYMARGMNANSSPNPEELVNDPAFVDQYILQNDDIRQKILSNYSQQKSESNQRTPNVMGTNIGGQHASLGEQRPQSIREASQLAQDWWMKQ